jgi:hypothetical protein
MNIDIEFLVPMPQLVKPAAKRAPEPTGKRHGIISDV